MMNNIIYERINIFAEGDPSGFIREMRQTCIIRSGESPDKVEVAIYDDFKFNESSFTIKKEKLKNFIMRLEETDDFTSLS